jgi:hypothetical protein
MKHERHCVSYTPLEALTHKLPPRLTSKSCRDHRIVASISLPFHFQGWLPVWLQVEVYQVSHLETVLHYVLIGIHLLLILCRLQVIFESSQDVLALLNPIFCFGCLAFLECSVHKGGGVITIQSFERCHPDRHVISGVIAMVIQV